MSEAVKTERTLEEINREYGNYCAQAGQAQYKIVTLNKDVKVQLDALSSQMEEFNDKLRDLNLEATKLQASQASAAAAPAPEPGAA